jgi:hypothetical protein
VHGSKSPQRQRPEAVAIAKELAMTDWERHRREVWDLAERARQWRLEHPEHNPLEHLADVLARIRKREDAVEAGIATPEEIAAYHESQAEKALHQHWHAEHEAIMAKRGLRDPVRMPERSSEFSMPAEVAAEPAARKEKTPLESPVGIGGPHPHPKNLQGYIDSLGSGEREEIMPAGEWKWLQ